MEEVVWDVVVERGRVCSAAPAERVVAEDADLVRSGRAGAALDGVEELGVDEGQKCREQERPGPHGD